MWNDGLDDGYHPWMDLATRIRWKMDNGDTVVVIFPFWETKYQYYMIHSEEELKTVMTVLNQNHTKVIIKIFDKNGHLTEEIKHGPSKLEDYEISMSNIEDLIKADQDLDDLIKKLDKEIKHKIDLKKRRDKRQQKKKEKGERL